MDILAQPVHVKQVFRPKRPYAIVLDYAALCDDLFLMPLRR